MRPKSFLSERDPEFVWDVKEESPDDLSYRFGYPSDMPTSEPADISRRAKREAVRVRRSAMSNVPHYKRKWAQEVFQAD